MLTTRIALAAALLLPSLDATAQTPVRVHVDSAAGEVVITAGPITIAPAKPYSHHSDEAYHVIDWPATGWMNGYRVDLVDSTGAPLPRTLIHHAGMANLDRRQLAYPIAERVFAAAHETTPVELPRQLGLPLERGQRAVLYYALVNPAPEPVRATLVVRMKWIPEGSRKVTPILPFYANAVSDSAPTISFDVPVGRSETSAEFALAADGWLRVVGGHLHDHGVELRLEEVSTGEVLARVRAKRTADGRLRDMTRARFPLKRRGVRLDAGRRYRIVAVYDNPTGKVIPGGAMGFMAGVFIPRGASQLAVNPTDPRYARDASALLGASKAVASHAHH